MSSNTIVLKNRTETAKKIYDRLKNDRQPYTDRAIECAKYTIPSLFPKDGDGSSTKYATPYQSVGARGINNVTNKLALTLFPPNSPFFRLSLSDEVKIDFDQAPAEKAEVEEALGSYERLGMRYFETHQLRITCMEAIKHLVVTGSGVLFLPPLDKGGVKFYKLNKFVIQRDALGNMVQMVTLDEIAYVALPEDLKAIVAKGKSDIKEDETVEVYTHIYRTPEDEQIYAYQEINGEVIAGTDQSYPPEKSPWIPLRMIKIDGENYGRSFVEEYLGDLKSLEMLSKSLVDMAAISAQVFFLVNPNGTTRVSKLEKLETGGFTTGRIEDIGVLQLNKYADMQVAKATADDITARLSYAFLLNSAVQRGGERVTAEEIRYVARELEDTLGGVYSILTQEFQLPLVRRILAQLQSMGEIPELPEGAMEPSITTGIEALGRGQDLNKLSMFLEYAMRIPEVQQRLNTGTLLTMIATSLSLDTTGLVKTDEEIQQEMQMQQMMQMAQGAAPNLAKGLVDANAPATEGQPATE